jgi:hypothetical protein
VQRVPRVSNVQKRMGKDFLGWFVTEILGQLGQAGVGVHVPHTAHSPNQGNRHTQRRTGFVVEPRRSETWPEAGDGEAGMFFRCWLRGTLPEDLVIGWLRRVARLMGGGGGKLARGIESEAAWRPVYGRAMSRCACALGVRCGRGIGCEWATTLPEPSAGRVSRGQLT